MSTHHAKAGEIVDLATWANDLPFEKSKAIVKSNGFELARLVIKAGEDMHKNGLCHVNGPTIFHCIEGEIDLQTSDTTVRLHAGQLAYLESQAKHAVTGIQDSVVLLTIVLT
ncbi:cupin domain-containing protein [Granulosicoccus antarcticus]|uniref:Cupin type-2 domain-containing protein n=1 Tax=Granulosicoccus antarcticus IMCC3135 TaxID=1192854 RepID=A0A2Z2P0B1_9GAMM|nr:cupin domain-containing protein [Granulosicoccus antarcticus]ASJ73597.1 hypothetical protein IMCC3135_17590 [Granulosicoccus antarcticus IMCC3135]